MIEFTIEQDVAAPPDAAFAYATDPDKLATWQTNTVSATVEGGGPMRLGARLREVHRAPGGKELPSLVEVSEWEPSQRFALTMIEGALPLHARVTFAPQGSGTRVAFTAHGQPTGVMRVLQPVLRRTLRKQFTHNLEELAARLA